MCILSGLDSTGQIEFCGSRASALTLLRDHLTKILLFSCDSLYRLKYVLSFWAKLLLLEFLVFHWVHVSRWNYGRYLQRVRFDISSGILKGLLQKKNKIKIKVLEWNFSWSEHLLTDRTNILCQKFPEYQILYFQHRKAQAAQ